MPQSLANVLLHIVFSTKNRAPFLQDPAIREEMNGYMVGTLKAIECPSLIVRAVEDHLGLRNLAPLGLLCSAAEQ